MSQDANRYPDPLSFKPERWIPGEASIAVPALRPQEYVFGFGRRSVELVSSDHAPFNEFFS